ncbi:MAG: O-methyltransferase [Cytophagales bacterium]
MQYIKYFFRAKDEHFIQAPFLYHFYLKVLKNASQNADFQLVEIIRKQLFKNNSAVGNFDLGAGTRTNVNSKSVRKLAHTSISSPKKCRLLFNIIQYFNYSTIVEVGTSLGVATAYLAMANEKAKIFSLEGNKDLIREAEKVKKALNLGNIEFILGNFDQTLPELLNNQKEKIDFVFLDGNHQFEPTIKYFELMLPHLHDNSILIIDDIYWSEEMTKAWATICSNLLVTISLDLYSLGILFFSTKYSKQHFVLKY